MTRTVSLGPNGFVVSDDYEDMLSRFLNTNVLGDHANQLATLFAPDGEGFYIPSLGGAHRIEERDGVLPPNDEDPSRCVSTILRQRSHEFSEQQPPRSDPPAKCDLR